MIAPQRLTGKPLVEQVTDRILLQTGFRHVAVIEAVFGPANDHGRARISVIVLDHNIGLADVRALEGHVQIVADPLGRDVFRRVFRLFVDQLVAHVLLRFDAQRLAFRAITGLDVVLRNRLRGVVDLDLDFHACCSLNCLCGRLPVPRLQPLAQPLRTTRGSVCDCSRRRLPTPCSARPSTAFTTALPEASSATLKYCMGWLLTTIGRPSPFVL